MDEEARKRKVEYNMNRNKEIGYKTFGTKLEPKEFKEINDFIIQHGFNKADLIRYGYKQLKLKNDTTDKDILLKGKNVIRKYNNLMTLNDRNTIDEFNKELDKIIKEV